MEVVEEHSLVEGCDPRAAVLGAKLVGSWDSKQRLARSTELELGAAGSILRHMNGRRFEGMCDSPSEVEQLVSAVAELTCS